MNSTGEDDATILRRADALVYVESLGALSLDAQSAHHLCDVLRLDARATVVASDGKGGYRCCKIARTAPSAHARKARPKHQEPEASAELVAQGPIAVIAARDPLTVGFALQKGERAEWTVQKLTELGIDRIVPLITDRTVVRLGEKDAARRAARFRAIAREAGAQSRRVHLPEVADPEPLADFFARVGQNAVLAEPGGPPMAPGTDTVLVGPEGGWSDRERSFGLPTIGLGPTVLRAETAAIAAGVLLSALRERVVLPS